MPDHRRPRPPPSDRFHAMIRLRKEETRYSPGGAGGGYDDGPLPAEDIVGLYEEVLSELTFNSKPMIGDLTAIAGEQREHARGIASAICNRILKVPADQKLPSLYLLDSIVKNVGREYVVHFTACLPKVFCEAYNQVDSSLHPAMRHLLGTWSQVFHPSVLRKIEDELHFSTPLNQRVTGLADRRYSQSPSPGPTHGIHVNPKYLEARHQFEHSASRHVVGSCNDEDRINLEGDPVETLGRNTSESPERWSGVNPKFHDVRHLKGVSSGLQVYERKPCIQIGDYGLDSFESLSPGHEIARQASPETTTMHASSMVGVERPLPYLNYRRSRSPPRNGLKRSLSPANGRFQRDISFERGERASPSHSGHGFGHERVHDQNGRLDRKWRSDNDAQSQESSTGHDLKNIYAKQRSRELIDAYGDHRETDNFHEKRPKVQQLDVIGIASNTTTRNWQSSEEEEFIWEDMSPTLANHDNRKSLQPFNPSNEMPGSSRPGDILLEPDLRRGDRANQASRHPLVDEDKIPFTQDSVGVEFNPEVLKVRHESAVNALYADLPRQCTTCGLRFRCQEEHSSHMDWHVTKNRVSKNRKQQPSRKWFVSGKEWLSSAEVLGTDVVPGFAPEAVMENKGDAEMAVPADENQTMCALCGEVFEDFYSDETEEWMYKHAVYLNARNGSIEGLDISQRGPIVHDKCRPESVEDTRLS